MSFVAKGGRVVTDDMLDKWADDADNGEFGGRPGAVYSGPVAQADAVSRTFSLSADMSAMLDAVAKRRGVSADDIMRHALVREFASV
jgi:hypothetical protein